ncbi:hypothetical protein BC834DRAFT_885601 [Gloeopeniophorella convolvens]|nr:hypothetical protein BC834DRAFT_885601 [Gloeopeniophorella convolvens]
MSPLSPCLPRTTDESGQLVCLCTNKPIYRHPHIQLATSAAVLPCARRLVRRQPPRWTAAPTPRQMTSLRTGMRVIGLLSLYSGERSPLKPARDDARSPAARPSASNRASEMHAALLARLKMLTCALGATDSDLDQDGTYTCCHPSCFRRTHVTMSSPGTTSAVP